MPHWRQEAKENARLVRHTKVMLEALEAIVNRRTPGKWCEECSKIARAALERVKANSTEPVE